MRNLKTIKTVRLNVAQQEKFKEQILLILADYQTTNLDFVRRESFRLEVARRIMDSLRIVTTL